MRVIMFYHTLVSDWNHGNAHFLRGVATELLARGHEVKIFEPRDSWSARLLIAEHGLEPVRRFHRAYPGLKVNRYELESLKLDSALKDADLVLVHEWNDSGLIARIGEHRKRGGAYRLFFHDTHHRMVTDPAAMARYELKHYDGVLAYGQVLQELYERSGRVRAAWTWHEAADVRVFKPQPGERREGDLVWIGNWGDEERTAELHEFLIRPSRDLGLRTRVHGVRYPQAATEALAAAGIEYGGWLPNFDVPRVFGRYAVTVHVPRGPYVRALRGIPTIRPFEALACGIPLVCSPWDDVEGLFTPGRDFLVARNGSEMQQHLKAIIQDESLRGELSKHGLETIRARHTCKHRVDQLLAIEAGLRPAKRGINELKKEEVSLQGEPTCPASPPLLEPAGEGGSGRAVFAQKAL